MSKTNNSIKFLLVFYCYFSQSICKAHEYSIMSYNVENLFDVTHEFNRKDCLKESKSYRQKKCIANHWDKKQLALKLSQIVSVIKHDKLPDFLGIVEIENRNVLKLLAKGLGYINYEITNGSDPRGINVALLFKAGKNVKLISKNELLIPTPYPTRNILEIRFKIESKYFITLFVNHWPSLQNPENSRTIAAQRLIDRTLEVLKKNPSENILALGDFNTVSSDLLLKKNLFQEIDWYKTRIGTYFYAPKNEWSILDHFFGNINLFDNKDLEIVKNSFKILNYEFLCKDSIKKQKNGDLLMQKIPREFNNKKMGYSDHFPILVRIKTL